MQAVNQPAHVTSSNNVGHWSAAAAVSPSSVDDPSKAEVVMNSSYNALNSTPSEDYVYDYETTWHLPFAELVPVAMVYGLTLIVGAIGNALVIVAIARFKRLQSVTNIFLVSLASADLLIVTACVPIKFARWFAFTWRFGEFMCKAVHYLQNVSVICSVLTLTTLSLERYYAIMKPMKARYICTLSRAKRLVLLLWLASFCLALPILKGQVLEQVGYRHVGYWCTKEWYIRENAWGKVYEVYMLLLILVFPLVTMSFAYISICLELWTVMSGSNNCSRNGSERLSPNSRFKLRASSGSAATSGEHRRKPLKAVAYNMTDDNNNTRKQVIKMLVAIVILFAICWSPTLIDGVLVGFGVVDSWNMGSIKYARQAFAIMSYANSCVNPVVYAFMSKNFRNSFRKTLSCGRQCSPQGRLDLQRIVRGPGQKRGQGPDIGTGPSSTILITTTSVCTHHVQVGGEQHMTSLGVASVPANGGIARFASGGRVGNSSPNGLVATPRGNDANELELMVIVSEEKS